MTLEELYRLLRSSHVQTQGVMDTLAEPLLVLDRSLCVLSANPAFFRTFRAERDAVLGSNLFELGSGEWNIDELRALLSEVVPKAKAIVGYEITHNFPIIGQRTMLLTARQLQHPDENSSQMLLVFEDVTERKKADAAKDMLLAETRHRMKNLIAILRAIASQTETVNRTAEEFRDVLMGRFVAAMDAQNLLFEPGVDPDLSALIEQAMWLEQAVQPVGRSRIMMGKSPPVQIPQRQAVPVSMMLHELTTNALKYGALSSTEGEVQVSWDIEQRDGSRFLLLEWQERGGPPVSPPSQTGFGTKLLESSARAEDGEAVFNYAPTGLHVSIALSQEQ